MFLFYRSESNLFFLDEVEQAPAPVLEPEVTHHIFVVDRSGSMWGVIDGLKSSIEQVLAVEDATNSNVETSLISFSSHRDVKLHWSGVKVEDVNNLSNPYLGELRSIQATFLTGISQGLELALEQVKAGQTTGITLFTDGYANDPSSSAENKALDAFVQKVKDQYPGVFVNCIGYRDWCDWPRMEAIAGSLSGKCVKARSFKDVLGAMKDTQALLAGSLRPAISVEGVAGVRVLAVNQTTGQVNLSTEGEALALRGVGADDKVRIFRVTKAEKTRNAPKGIKAIPQSDYWMVGAMARAFSGVGEIRTAKEILFSSGNKSLWEEHLGAMTPSSLAAMNQDLSAWVMEGGNDLYVMGRNVRPPHNLFDLAAAINALPPRSLGIDKDSFYKSYRRRSIKSLPGKRNDDGTITAPLAELTPRKNARTYVKSIDFNTSDASVQVATETAVWVKRLSDGEVFEEVEFVSLDGLRDYRTYTLISSGERNVEILPLEVYTEKAWNAIAPFILPHEARTFEPGQKAKIALKKFRMEADECPNPSDIKNLIDARATAIAEQKTYSAMLDKVAASPLTEKQAAALVELHLSPALYFSAPSHYHYADKDEAIRKGLIDSYTRYKVNFGTLDILDTGDFRSGNAFLDRRYKVTLNGAEVKKPKLDIYLQGATYTVKPPGKAKDTAADAVMATVADEVLLADTRITNEEISDRLRKAKGRVDSTNNSLQGIVMEVGCTGLLPAELDWVATRYEAEEFATKYGVKLGKAQQEGVFFVLPGDVVVSVIPETSWYTVKVEEEAQAAAK